MDTSTSRTVWVLGGDVSQSRSPEFHNAYYRERGWLWRYSSCSLAPDRLEDMLRALWCRRAIGCNLTNPLKEIAFRYLSRGQDGEMRLALSGSARRLGSVNTIKVTPTGLLGHSTDGEGWWRALAQRFALTSLEGYTVLLLGAGGAARAIFASALDHGASELHVVNRSPERATAMIDSLGDARCRYEGPRWDQELPKRSLIIQATSCRGESELSQLFSWQGVPASALACDILYGDISSAFVRQAQELGIAVQDGLDMLHRQAELSIDVWASSDTSALNSPTK